MARVSPASSVHLSRHAQIVTHTFILEAVGGKQCICITVFCAFKCQRSFLKALVFGRGLGGDKSIATSVEKLILKHGIRQVVNQYLVL